METKNEEIADNMNRYFKDEKLEELNNLFGSYLQIFNDKSTQYPTKVIIFGFPQTPFDNEAEVYGRIKMLGDLLSIPINIKFVEEEYKDGSKKIQCYIEKIEETNDTK